MSDDVVQTALTLLLEVGCRDILLVGDAAAIVRSVVQNQQEKVRFVSHKEFSLEALRKFYPCKFYDGIRRLLSIPDSVSMLVFENIDDFGDSQLMLLEAILKQDVVEEGDSNFSFVWAISPSKRHFDQRLVDCFASVVDVNSTK